MKSPRLVLLLCALLAALLGTAADSRAQGAAAAPGTPAAEAPVVPCNACKNRGFSDCRKHDRKLAREAKVIFCSEASACATCGGTYQIDCKICRNEAVENAAAARRELVKKWFADRRDNVEKFTKSKKVLHIKSKHFDLTFSIAPMRVGKSPRLRDQHELMHIWIDRLEKHYASFCKLLELEEKDFAVPVELYMFEKSADHRAIAPRKIGADAGRASGKKYMGDKMIFSMWRHPQEMRNDADMRRYMAHHVTHLFVNHMAPHTWIFNKGHGWLDAGVAHWFEFEEAKLCTNFCYEEVGVDPGTGWKGGKWKTGVRNLVDAGKAPRFSSFYEANTDQLGLEVHAMSFAYVDFLIDTQGGAKLRDLIRMVKEKVPTRDAMQKIYGLNPLTIDEKFTVWVKSKYPKFATRRQQR